MLRSIMRSSARAAEDLKPRSTYGRKLSRTRCEVDDDIASQARNPGSRQEFSLLRQAKAAGPRGPGECDGLPPPGPADAYQTELHRYEPPNQRSHFRGCRRLPA